eukprot:PITA_05571
MPAQPNPNPNNRQAQLVYTGETTCPTYAVEIQEINLRSGKVLPECQPPPSEEEEEKQESEPQAIPPFPERLTATTKPNPEEDELLGELKQLCVKIPLLQAIKDVPIYNKLIKEKCFRHPGRRKKDASTINVIGQLSYLMLGQVICLKYLDLGSPVVDVHMNGTIIPHNLIDLGAAINVMTRDTMLKINLQSSLRKTSTVLQLADRSTVTPEGIVEDVLVSVDSWEYLAEFLVLQPKAKLTGYPLILGRPWLATTDAYISCRAGSMTIKNGPMSKQLVLYPPAQPSIEHDLPVWLEEGEEDEVYFAPLCTVEATKGGPPTEDDLIENLIQNPPPSELSLEELVEDTQANALVDLSATNPTNPRVKNVEFGPEKTLKISSSLSSSQEKELCSLLTRHLEAFAWSYKEMKGIHPSVYTHHIYIKEDCKPVRQPQRRMNPTLKDIVKEEVQKLLDAGFIYPISDSEWVSPLVLVPKKNGKWRICVDYRELNKATKKDHFPLPFIDQVLDGLAGKRFFSFLDGFSGYNQIQISPEDQDKTTFTCPWGTFAYRVLPFGLCNAPATFQRAVLSIFAELVHDSVEIYMDDFTPYGSSFQEALSNLGKVLSKCIGMNLSLSPEKYEFLMTEGTILGHTISRQGLQVDPNKVAIIKRVPPPQKKALNELKDKLVSAPILRGSNWALPFHIHMDASNKAIGAALGQVEEKLPYAIYFVSKNLSKAEMNYTVTEKEFLAVVHALNKFRHYITGYQTFVHTDHAATRYLMNKPDVNAHIIRWLLLLQQFDLTIIDKPGRENVVADFLSRLDLPAGEEGTVDDQMPDKHLFSISVLSPWFDDIENYLVSA